MEKTTKTSIFYAQFVLNAGMPHNIRSKERTFTVHRDTETHKKGDVVVIPARKAENVPFSIPGVKHILDANNIEVNKFDNRHFSIVGSDKDKLNEKVENIKELFNDNQIAYVVIHPLTQEKPKKKKKPSNNKPSTGAPKRTTKFEKKTLEQKGFKLPRKMKKAVQKEALEYTRGMLNDMNNTHLSKSQLKRAKHRIELIEFVNAMCDQNFDSYKETMRFIRNHNKSEIKAKIAA